MCHLSPSIADLHALNLEALAPSVNCQNPFAECVAFKHRPNDYCAYGVGPNSRGKSMGALVHPDLRPRGLSLRGLRILRRPLKLMCCRRRSPWSSTMRAPLRALARQVYGLRADEPRGPGCHRACPQIHQAYRESISVCSQLQATRGGDARSQMAYCGLSRLLGHYGRNDADEAAKAHWSSGKLEPTAAAELRGVVLIEEECIRSAIRTIYHLRAAREGRRRHAPA